MNGTSSAYYRTLWIEITKDRNTIATNTLNSYEPGGPIMWNSEKETEVSPADLQLQMKIWEQTEILQTERAGCSPFFSKSKPKIVQYDTIIITMRASEI